MKNLLVLSVLIACATMIAGCAAKAPEETVTPEVAAIPEAAEIIMVEVPAEGANYDPAVAIEQIPEGSWYCDMGTVHYARAEKGDGECARCQMSLVQKATDEHDGEPMSDADIEAASTNDEDVDEPVPEEGNEVATSN